MNPFRVLNNDVLGLVSRYLTQSDLDPLRRSSPSVADPDFWHGIWRGRDELRIVLEVLEPDDPFDGRAVYVSLDASGKFACVSYPAKNDLFVFDADFESPTFGKTLWKYRGDFQLSDSDPPEFSSTGRYLVVTMRSSRCIVVDWRENRQVTHFSSQAVLSFNPSDTRCAVVIGTVYVYDVDELGQFTSKSRCGDSLLMRCFFALFLTDDVLFWSSYGETPDSNRFNTVDLDTKKKTSVEKPNLAHGTAIDQRNVPHDRDSIQFLNILSRPMVLYRWNWRSNEMHPVMSIASSGPQGLESKADFFTTRFSRSGLFVVRARKTQVRRSWVDTDELVVESNQIIGMDVDVSGKKLVYAKYDREDRKVEVVLRRL